MIPVKRPAITSVTMDRFVSWRIGVKRFGET
jgi:hypothetical protein